MSGAARTACTSHGRWHTNALFDGSALRHLSRGRTLPRVARPRSLQRCAAFYPTRKARFQGLHLCCEAGVAFATFVERVRMGTMDERGRAHARRLVRLSNGATCGGESIRERGSPPALRAAGRRRPCHRRPCHRHRRRIDAARSTSQSPTPVRRAHTLRRRLVARRGARADRGLPSVGSKVGARVARTGAAAPAAERHVMRRQRAPPTLPPPPRPPPACAQPDRVHQQHRAGGVGHREPDDHHLAGRRLHHRLQLALPRVGRGPQRLVQLAAVRVPRAGDRHMRFLADGSAPPACSLASERCPFARPRGRGLA